MACGLTPRARATSDRLMPSAKASFTASARSSDRRANAARWVSMRAAARRALVIGSVDISRPEAGDGVEQRFDFGVEAGSLALGHRRVDHPQGHVVALGMPIEGGGFDFGVGEAAGDIGREAAKQVSCHALSIGNPRVKVNPGVKDFLS